MIITSANQMVISLIIFTVLVADVLVYIPAVFQFSFLCLGRKPALNKVKKDNRNKKGIFWNQYSIDFVWK